MRFIQRNGVPLLLTLVFTTAITMIITSFTFAPELGLIALSFLVLVAMFMAIKASWEKYLIRTGRM